MNPALARHLQTLGLERAPFPPTPDAAAWFQTARLEAERVEAAHCLYQEKALGARDDAAAMQYLIPNWKFDNKRPCLVR